MKSRMMIMMAAGAIMAFRGVLAADIPANSSRLTYAENPDGTLMVTGVEPGGIVDGKLIVPESHDGTNVTTLNTGVFANNEEIKSVHLPSTLCEISMAAFVACVNLTSVYIADGVTNLNDGAFYMCSSLEHIRLPQSLQVIGSDAFSGCAALAEVEFPDGLKRIEFEAFSPSGIKEVILPDSVEYLGVNAFRNCGSLTNAVLASNLKVVPEAAFQLCKNLKSVLLPAHVEIIGGSAFASTEIETVVIPASCTNMGHSVFSNVKAAYFDGDAPKTSMPGMLSLPPIPVGATLYLKYNASGFDEFPWVDKDGHSNYNIIREKEPEEGNLLITAFAVEGEKMNFTVRLVDEQGGQNIPDAGRKVRLLGAGLLTEEFEECSEPIALDANGSFEANLPEGKTTFFFKVRLEPAE